MHSILKRFKQKALFLPKRIYHSRLKGLIEATAEVGELFPEGEMMQHYSSKVMRNNIFHPDLLINQIRYYRLYEYFKRYHPDMFIDSTRILNVGDSSGTLFKAMKKRGDSVNIDPKAVSHIQKRGITAYRTSIYELPFKDKSYDYVVSFQCLEHLENPLAGLKEITRVARKKVFVSIPYQEKTKIYSRKYWEDLIKAPQEEGGWEIKAVNKDCDYHIFEFSAEDFINLIDYTAFTCKKHFPINYFSPLGEEKKNKGSYFNFFELEPKD